MTADQAVKLITKAAIAIARPNRDGSVAEDHVNTAIEQLMEAVRTVDEEADPALARLAT